MIYGDLTVQIPAIPFSHLGGPVFSFLRRVVLICQIHKLLSLLKMWADPNNNEPLQCSRRLLHGKQWLVLWNCGNVHAPHRENVGCDRVMEVVGFFFNL